MVTFQNKGTTWTQVLHLNAQRSSQSSNKLKPCTHESKMSTRAINSCSVDQQGCNKTRQATHLEGETYDIVRDLFSALSFEKTLSAAQKRGLPQKFMSLDYRVCRAKTAFTPMRETPCSIYLTEQVRKSHF